MLLPTTDTGVQALPIVPIGKVVLLDPIPGMPDFALQVFQKIRNLLPDIAGRMLDENLETELETFLERKWYERRRRSKRKVTEVKYSKCQSQERQDFRRNGHYQRGLATELVRCGSGCLNSSANVAAMCVLAIKPFRRVKDLGPTWRLPPKLSMDVG